MGVAMQHGYVYIGGGVPCPKCQEDSRVDDTYWSRTRDQQERRRVCKSCGNIFRTAEVIIQKTVVPRGPRGKR